MSARQQNSEGYPCMCHARQLQSHIGAVHIMHAVTAGVVEYLHDKEDADGTSLASALVNANRLLRATLPAYALEDQQLKAAFSTVSDGPPPHREEPAEA